MELIPYVDCRPAAPLDSPTLGAALIVERSVRCGEGDPELASALKRDTDGDWD